MTVMLIHLCLSISYLSERGSKQSKAAHVLLLLSRTYRSELESILPKAATIWLDAPYDEEQILNVLFATSTGTTFDDELLQRFLRGALVHPRGSLFGMGASE